MKTIRIISGVYGHRPKGAKFVHQKRAGDIIEVESDKAERLVALKVAEYVNQADFIATDEVATGESEENKSLTTNNPLDDEDTPDEDLQLFERPHYNAEMKIDELRKIMDEYGLVFRVGMSKEDIVENLDAYFDNLEDELPDITSGDIIP